MKIRILLLLCLIVLTTGMYSQVLYSSTTEVGNRFNPGTGQAGTPKVAFDDISISNSAVAGIDSIVVTKVKVGIRRTPGAPATDVKIYYATYDDTSTQSAFIKIPPVLLGTVSLPAMGASLETTVVSVGDSVSALFKMKVDTNAVYAGYHTFFIGTALSNDNTGNALRVTSGPKANKDILWIYNADSLASLSPASFDNSVATFYIQVFGRPLSTSLLPVSLSSLKGKHEGGISFLTWTTETELNNKGFDVQRSADGIAFNSIAFVATKGIDGCSNLKLSYNYVDKGALRGNNYYRLRQKDKDGHLTLSDVVLVKSDKTDALKFTSVYPNPAKSTLNIDIASPASEKINILITDFSGKIFISGREKVITGVNNLSLNVSKLNAGTYTIKAISESTGMSAVYKFIKE